jgi:hypothetical protein
MAGNDETGILISLQKKKFDISQKSKNRVGILIKLWFFNIYVFKIYDLILLE